MLLHPLYRALDISGAIQDLERTQTSTSTSLGGWSVGAVRLGDSEPRGTYVEHVHVGEDYVAAFERGDREIQDLAVHSACFFQIIDDDVNPLEAFYFVRVFASVWHLVAALIKRC